MFYWRQVTRQAPLRGNYKLRVTSVERAMGAVLRTRGSGESLDAENEQFDVFTTASDTAGVEGSQCFGKRRGSIILIRQTRRNA